MRTKRVREGTTLIALVFGCVAIAQLSWGVKGLRESAKDNRKLTDALLNLGSGAVVLVIVIYASVVLAAF